MNSDIQAYTPDFPVEQWTEKERMALQPFFTNLDGFVTVMRNLPAELAGALSSRASRAQGSIPRILWNEYIEPILNGSDRALAKQLIDTVNFLRTAGFKDILNNQRAQSFYAKWLSQYGDDSIAQMTGTHLVFWGISQVALKFIEDQRIGLAPIEKSTRYVDYSKKIGGRHLYYAPNPDLRRLGLEHEYRDVMSSLFEANARLQAPLKAWLMKNFDAPEAALEKKAFDTLRGLLPMATLSQVVFYGNAQAFEYTINRCRKHPLGELRWIAGAAKTELDHELFSLLLRVDKPQSEDYQEHLAHKREFLSAPWIDGNVIRTSRMERAQSAYVRIDGSDANLVERIIASALFSAPDFHATWMDASIAAQAMSGEQKRKFLAACLGNRKERWWKVPRAFENANLRWEIVMDIGAYRDLHRHRMHTQDRQLFSIHHGFAVPQEIQEAGLEPEYRQPLELVESLFHRLESESPLLAQYVVPLAYRIRFYQYQNVRQFFWETELRTGPQGHPDYRRIEQEKFRLFSQAFPLLAPFVKADMNDYPIARRGDAERASEKEARIIDAFRKQ